MGAMLVLFFLVSWVNEKDEYTIYFIGSFWFNSATKGTEKDRRKKKNKTN